MKRLQRHAVILSLVEALLQRDSWCSETHVQKTIYFLQELLNVPLGFEYILYKHGPFSFDLSDELMAMRADEIIRLKSRPPYGPSIISGSNGDRIKKLFPKTLCKYKEEIEFVAEEIGDYGVSELERLATALYVTLNDTTPDHDEIEERASRINKLKPHISLEDARRSLENRWKISSRAKKFIQAT
ncbi:MAG: hypothetical protein JW837_01840 [Sedimentisphaerales bacterium]|nr:hypothetical protein [Sedimentisphaerales bacterium]